MSNVSGGWWSPYLPLVKQVLALQERHLNQVDVFTTMRELDKRGVDLMVQRRKAEIPVAVRVRRWGASRSEFTIRSMSNWQREKVEMVSLLAGACDWMFYGIVGKDAPGPSDLNAGRSLYFSAWVLLDLHVWRRTVKERGGLGFELPNRGRDGQGDGTAFTTYRLSDFPDAMVLRQYPAGRTGMLPGMDLKPVPVFD